MRILDRYLLREMTITFAAVTLVLLVIMIGNVLGRSLSQVSEGRIQADMLLSLVGARSIGLLVTLIPLGMYLGILLAHGKLYRDNEMAVMQACGVSWFDLLRPTAWLGLLGVLLILLLTIYASPWAVRHEEQLKQQMAESGALALLTPGRFVESDGGRIVLFVGDASANRSQFHDVFMYRQREDEPPAVDIARLVSWQRDPDSGDEFMVFKDGQTTIGQPGDREWVVTEFETQGLLRPESNARPGAVKAKSKSIQQLRESDELADKAELQWRVSIPLAALILALLAVPLSYSSPREGRFGRIVIAILLYIPYSNLLVLARKWIAAGSLPSWIGLWPVHGLMLLLLAVLIVRRQGLINRPLAPKRTV